MESHVRQQATIAQAVTVSGKGYWTGIEVDVEFRPACENSGITFVRADLLGNPRIVAHVSNRVKGPRRTSLVQNGIAVEMVEHILAALSGLQIDNCEVWVNQQEMPGCDGSSIDFVQALIQAGRVKQNRLKTTWKINDRIRVGDDKSWIHCEPYPDDELCLVYHLDYRHPSIGIQVFESVVTPDTFKNEIAAARTFVLEAEANLLRDQGLGVHVGYDEILVFDHDGPIQNRVRFENECARHKVLDMIGDLALTGVEIRGRVTAFRSGHRLNAMLAATLLKQMNRLESTLKSISQIA